jgi:hypothetical protein
VDAAPRAFRPSPAVRALNVACVAASVAAIASAGMMVVTDHGSWWLASFVGIPTVVVATAWATVMRSNRVSPIGGLRWGWVAAAPLALLDMEIQAAQLDVPSLAERLLLGATYGALLWVPGMLLVLGAYGVPMARAQRLGKLGLDEGERGETFVALVSAGIAAAAFVIADTVNGHVVELGDPRFLGVSNEGFFDGLAGASILCGAAAAALAALRRDTRRRFLARAEAGQERGFRVEMTSRGKVLVADGAPATYRNAGRGDVVFHASPPGAPASRPAPTSSKPVPLVVVVAIACVLMGIVAVVAAAAGRPERPCPPNTHRVSHLLGSTCESDGPF